MKSYVQFILTVSLGLLLCSLNGLDAIMTIIAIEKGAEELNPIWSALINASPIAFVVLKTISVLLFTIFLVAVALTHRRGVANLARRGLILTTFVYVCVIGWHIHISEAINAIR